MRAIIVSPEARGDLTDYYDYIAQTNQSAALALFDAARQTFADLARFPGMGRLYEAPGVQSELRRWHIKGFQNYLIFYRVREESIEILRILYGSQDVVVN